MQNHFKKSRKYTSKTHESQPRSTTPLRPVNTEGEKSTALAELFFQCCCWGARGFQLRSPGAEKVAEHLSMTMHATKSHRGKAAAALLLAGS